MKRFLITLGLTILLIASSQSQENAKYVKKELSKLSKLMQKGKFVDGTIYTPKDTSRVKILKFKGSKKRNYHLFCVCKHNNSIAIYKPDQLSAYRIDEVLFISRKTGKESIFLKQVKQGEIDLYEKPSIPSDNRFLYYLKLPNEQKLFIINPDENNVTMYDNHENGTSDESKNSSDFRIIYKTAGIHQQFKAFVRIYLETCPQVVNMVNAEFYTINHIPSIVETYNNCSGEK